MIYRERKDAKLIHRISGLLASPSLAPAKLDELRIKANILSSFAEKKLEDAASAVSGAAADATEQVKKASGQATEGVKRASGQAAEGVEAFAAMVEEQMGRGKDEL